MSEDKLNEKQKEQMNPLMSDNMKDSEFMTALWILSSILKEYYNITKYQKLSNKQRNGMTATVSETQISTAHGM